MELNIKLNGLRTAIADTKALLSADKLITVIGDLELQSHRLAALITRVQHLVKHAGEKVDDATLEPVFIALDEAEDLNIQVNVRLTQLFRENPPPNAAATFTPASSSAPVTKERQLDIVINKFNGDRVEYSSFKKSIEVLISRKSNPSAQEQFLFLQQNLGDVPKSFIQNLPLSETSYATAWAILDAEYSDETRVKADIFSQLSALPPAVDEPEQLKATFNKVESLLRVLESYEKSPGDVNRDETHRRLVLSKFPLTFVRHITTPGETLTLEHARKSIAAAIRTETDLKTCIQQASPSSRTSATVFITKTNEIPANSSTSSNSPSSGSSKPPATAGRSISEPKRPCQFCQGKHFPSACDKYKTTQQRVDALPPNSCVCCFKRHSGRCRSARKCYHCDSRKHHQALCPDKFGPLPVKDIGIEPLPAADKSLEKNAPMAPASQKASVNLARSYRTTHHTAMVRIQNPITGKEIEVRAMFDEGAGDSFILQSRVEELGLESIATSEVDVSVFGTRDRTAVATTTVNFLLKMSRKTISIWADSIDYIQDDIRAFNIDEFRSTYPQFKEYPFAETGNGNPIDILIGNDFRSEILEQEPQIEVVPGLYIFRTNLGWLITGRMKAERTKSAAVLLSTTKSLSTLWDLDTLGIREPNLKKEEEEQAALQKFYDSVCYDEEEKRYSVAWPWRSYPPDLPTNFGIAMGVLRSLFRRTSPSYLKIVDTIFKEQVAAGVIEIVNEAEPTPNTHYLPYHLVVKEGKSTAVRVVYNASAKTGKNPSLNDCLHKGTNFLPSMLTLLLRFRVRRVAVTADIAKAFHQVLLQPQERDFLRFLWRNEGQDDVITYRFRRVPFGVVSSPFILAAMIRYLLEHNRTPHTSMILDNLYADNLLVACDTVEEARSLMNDAVETFKKATMNLRLWNSNESSFREFVPDELRDSSSEVSILGLRWNRNEDTFRLAIPKTPLTNLKYTMAEVLKLSAQLYDPLGWVAPVTVRAKLLLRTCHRKQYNWTSQLSDEESALWRVIYADLLAIDDIKIGRFLPTTDARYEFHCFSDASQDIYASAVYLRCETQTGIHTRLLITKARVAPTSKNELTIPKLELMAAVVTSRLLTLVRTALQLTEANPAIIWIDSKCVLHWIRSTNTTTTFVRNRVNEIRKLENTMFRYVPSAENVADLPTRTCSTAELCDRNEWWTGPAWLSQPPDHWPPPKVASSSNDFDDSTESAVDPEEPHNTNVLLVTTAAQSPFTIDASGYNSYRRLIRTTAYCILAVKKFRRRRRRDVPSPLNRDPFSAAKIMWLQYAQRSAFPDIVTNLQQADATPLPLVKRLGLRLDSDKIIRCNGRFPAASSPDQRQSPALLPKPSANHFVFLYVSHVHATWQHAGTNTTLMKVQEYYWFAQAKREVYRVLTKCAPCKRRLAKPFSQPTESTLPPFRLDANDSPFSNMGIDVCGPFTVLQEKKHILLTTCLVTRGVALEVVDALETAHLHAALRRIAARRTEPKFYLSDNAPQFLLLRTHLQQLATSVITWKLIPPFSPWQGGAYERLISPLKASLISCLRANPFVGPTQFRTLVAEIENVVNMRPLLAVSANADYEVLTPNHFLKPTHEPVTFNLVAPMPATEAARNLANFHRRTVETLRQFWNLWSTAYLQSLRNRPAVMNFQQTNRLHHREPAIGDVVIVKDDLRKRAQWKLGKVVSLRRSEDTQVRAAELEVGSRKRVGGQKIYITRPLQDLYFMEMNADTDT